MLPCHLANVALRTGERIFFDSARNACFADPDHKLPLPQADRLLAPTYREGHGLSKG